MPDSNPNQDTPSLRDTILYIVGAALLVIFFVNFSLSLVASRVIEKGGVKGNFPDYIQFTQYYLSTFLLSFILTVAISVFAISRMYGYNIHCTVPVFIVILGSLLIRMSFSDPAPTLKAANYNPFELLVAWSDYLLERFDAYYGTASFLTGTVVGVSGGLVLIAIAHHYRGKILLATRRW
jgi:hypothetical protein